MTKREPNLSPLPLTEREIRFKLAQRQQWEVAAAHRLAWNAAHPYRLVTVTLKDVSLHPATAERAHQLLAMLEAKQ